MIIFLFPRLELGEPFKPLDQLLAVISPISAQCLPPLYRQLILDENSEIIDFFPTELSTDKEKTNVLLKLNLPFIEEERLLTAISKYESLLSLEEQERNKKGIAIIFVHTQNEIYQNLSNKIETENNENSYQKKINLGEFTEWELGGSIIDSNISHKVNEKITSENDIFEVIKDNLVASFCFHNPQIKVCN